MSVVCLKTSVEEGIHNGEHKEAALTFTELGPQQTESSRTSSKVISTDELALLAKLEEANRYMYIMSRCRFSFLLPSFFFFYE